MRAALDYAMAILTTRRLTKRYGAVLALDGLDLALDEGAVFGFLGPNGSGKTTAIRLLLGLLRPSDGRAEIFGRDCWRESERIKSDLGYLPGDLRLYPSWTGELALRIAGRIRGRDLLAAGRRLAETFELDLGIRASAMSKGTRQKLGLVLALAHEPRLAVLDEPTTGLDPIMQDRLKSHLGSIAREGRTIFFSSHSLREVEQLCDRVAILRRGRMIVDTTLEALRARAHREVCITWSGERTPAPASLPGGLDVVNRSDGKWRCRWDGPAGPLLKWASGDQSKSIADISISPPDLEQLFWEYYRE